MWGKTPLPLKSQADRELDHRWATSDASTAQPSNLGRVMSSSQSFYVLSSLTNYWMI